MEVKKITLDDIKSKKKRSEKITMLTAYDYPTALLVDKAGIDMILVGDSLANVVLGLEKTTEVGMEVMIHHAKAVTRAVKNSFVVGDMPYEAYQVGSDQSVRNAKRFIDEAKCDAVKLEWFDNAIEVTKDIVKSGIPVMGHIGLTPQTADKLGGFKVQGKDADTAKALLKQALALEAAGSFSIVLECIPDKIAEMITSSLKIPTIGIGAGVDCDGQVLVIHDLLGLFDRYTPKFVKRYAHLNDSILDAVSKFKDEVVTKKFPDKEHSFSIKEEELKKIKG